MSLSTHLHTDRAPLLCLLHPRQQLRPMLCVLTCGMILGALSVALKLVPLWVATASVMAALLYPASCKWRDDLRRFGRPAMILSILLALQGFHMTEHLAQWIEYHLFQWHPRDSSGLLSAANIEVVHFVWNWAVLLAEFYLLRRGMRGLWAWLLVGWTTAHTLEHSYLLVQYLIQLHALAQQGASLAFAQGLPGILGRKGWLDVSPVTANSFLCDLPGITTAIRLDIHFWWNMGETALLLPAAHIFVAHTPSLIGSPAATVFASERDIAQ